MRRITVLLASVVVAAGCATISEQDLRRADIQRRLAEAKLSNGQLELAVRAYRASLEIHSESAEAHFGLGETFRRKGLLDDAERHFKEALRIDPEHHDARLNLSAVFLQQERWADAIRECTILFDDPTFLRPSRALVNRGWAHFKAGHLDVAARDLREALMGDSANVQAHLNLGLLLWEQGELLDSMVHLERVLDLVTRRPAPIFIGAETQARFHLASAHVKLGQRDKAVAHLRRASELGGDTELGRKSRELLGLLE